MPNWVYSTVSVEGPEEDISRFVAAAKGANHRYFGPDIGSQNPNQYWAAFTDIQIKSMIEDGLELSEPNTTGFCFHALYPIPATVLAMPYDEGALRRLRQSNAAVDAFCNAEGVTRSGYEWENDNWGCKWGDCSTEVREVSDTHVNIYFETAWSPCHSFWKKVSSDYPTLTITMDYTEEGGHFEGEAVYTAGSAQINEWEPERNNEDYDEEEDDDSICEGEPSALEE